MREIKFKGKRIDNVEWVYGDLINSATFGSSIRCDNGMDYTVIPETVGQFTGLKDSNEVVVYEGDVVWCQGHKCEVRYRDNFCDFAMIMENQNNGKFEHGRKLNLTKANITRHNIIVIGSIHVNK